MPTQKTPPQSLSEKIAQLPSPEKEHWQTIARVSGGVYRTGVYDFFKIVQEEDAVPKLTEVAIAVAKKLEDVEYMHPAKQWVMKRLIHNITLIREAAREKYQKQWYDHAEAQLSPFVELLRAMHEPMIQREAGRWRAGLSQTERMAFDEELGHGVGYAIAASKLNSDGNPTVSAVIKKRVAQVALRVSLAQKNNSVLLLEGNHAGYPHDGETTDAALDMNIFWQMVNKKMPEGYRKVFTLTMEGFSHAEIGEQLGITESTSRSQLTKANKWLRDQPLLKELAEEYGISRPSSQSR